MSRLFAASSSSSLPQSKDGRKNEHQHHRHHRHRNHHDCDRKEREKKRRRLGDDDNYNNDAAAGASKAREVNGSKSSNCSNPNLPVYAYRKQLVGAILRGDKDADDDGDSNKVVLVAGETGSGKSTQIPAYLLESSSSCNSRIVVTQPRRVAAVTLAERVAAERSTQVGKDVVGYRVRFDDRTRYGTQLCYATDGMLLREAAADPTLSRYGVAFLDEAHERSLQTDVLLGVVKRAREARRNTNRKLRVVVMSATLDLHAFESYFGGPTQVVAIRIPGRQFPVQTLYAKVPVDDYVEATVSTVLRILSRDGKGRRGEGGGGGGGEGSDQPGTDADNGDDTEQDDDDDDDDGDILAFLPGQEEIEDAIALLKRYLEEEEEHDEHLQWTGRDQVVALSQKDNNNNDNNSITNGVLVCPLYAALPPEAQLAAFRERPKPTLGNKASATGKPVADGGGWKRKVVLGTCNINVCSSGCSRYCIGLLTISTYIRSFFFFLSS